MKIEKALKFKPSRRPILNTVLVKDNWFYATDLETSIMFKTHRPIPDGVYQREGIETLERVGGDVDDFPNLDERFETKGCLATITLTKKDLSFLLDHASKDETRSYLCGVYFDFYNSKIVATDGFTMVYKNIGTSVDGIESVIVPSGTIKKALEIATKKTEIKVVLFKDNHKVVFLVDDVVISGQCIAREYPRWKPIVDLNFKQPVEFEIDSKLLDFKNMLVLFKEEGKKRHSALFKVTGTKVFLVHDSGKEFEVGVTTLKSGQNDYKFKVDLKLLERMFLDNRVSFKCDYSTNLGPMLTKHDGFEGCIMPLKF